MDQMPDTRTIKSITRGLGRRTFLRAATAAGLGIGAGLGDAHAHATVTEESAPAAHGRGTWRILQAGEGPIAGRHYLPSRTDEVLWGYVPTVHASPVLTVGSGETVTIAPPGEDRVKCRGVVPGRDGPPSSRRSRPGREAAGRDDGAGPGLPAARRGKRTQADVPQRLGTGQCGVFSIKQRDIERSPVEALPGHADTASDAPDAVSK